MRTIFTALLLVLSLSLVFTSCNSNNGNEEDENGEIVNDSTQQKADTSAQIEVLENIPLYQGRVTDYFGLFKEDEKAELVSICQEINESTRTLVLVLVVPDLKEENIDSYSIKVARAWKVEEGVLVVIAPKEGKLRVQVGEKIEYLMNTSNVQSIIDEHIAPNFPNNEYFVGTKGALRAIEGFLM